MNRQNIFLFISDISTFLGVSRYNPQNCFERLFKKYDYKTIENITNISKESIENFSKEKILKDEITENLKNQLLQKKITKRQFDFFNSKNEKEKQDIIKSIENTQECIDLLTLSKKDYIQKKIGNENMDKINSAKSLKDKKEKTNEITNDLKKNTNLSKETISLIDKEVKNIINTEHGIEKESNALETFEQIENVKLNTSQEFYKFKINTFDNYDFWLGGKLDGIHEDYIVEVKNRTKQFFYKIRDYEMIQIQLYMFLLNYNKAKLVEKLNDKIKIHDIYRNDELIKEILQKINIFTKLFINFLNNPDKKKEYYTSSFIEKENFIYYNFYLKIDSEFSKIVNKEIGENNSMECCISISE